MTIANWQYVAAAYGSTWIVLIGYAIRVHRALARARKDYDVAMENMERHL